ncbi:MAG: NUDIX hydrolase [Curvibacter sp.]|nr:NUDIX hydrolase [Curvibacter sp.]
MVIEINSEIVLGTPQPSSTVMVLRDGPEGLEVLMVRRHGRSAVLGGAHVFPGGKLDAADCEVPASRLDRPATELTQALDEPGLTPETAAGLYLAALRETHEECGLLLGLPDAHRPPEERLSFPAIWAQLGLPLPTRALAPWSRWITPRVPSVTNKRFDTRFFIALMPAQQTAAHDNHEATETTWLTPSQALHRYWDGAIDLAPPQIMSLSQLARHASAAQAWRAASVRPPALIEPFPFDEDGVRTICYPGDPRHPVARPAWPGPTRLSYRHQRFEPEGGLAALLDDPPSGL